MPNTKSAEKRVRGSARKAAQNVSVKSRLKTVEKKFLTALEGGNLDEARRLYSDTASTYDKAAKSGVVKKEAASRKRSRLQLRLNAATAKNAVKK